MKKYLSVFSLFISGSFFKLIALFLVMLVSQLLLFYTKLPYGFTDAVGIETVVATSKISIIFLLGFLLTAVILNITGADFSSKCSYTLKRLRISEKEVFVCQSIYNTFCFLTLWLMQCITVIAAYFIYVQHYSDIEIVKQNFISNQTLFLATYRNDFLHSIFPMDDVLRLVRNILFTVFLGFGSAGFSYLSRNKTFCFEFVAMAITAVGYFAVEWDDLSDDIVPMIICVCLTAFMLGRICCTNVSIKESAKEIPVLSEDELRQVGET